MPHLQDVHVYLVSVKLYVIYTKNLCRKGIPILIKVTHLFLEYSLESACVIWFKKTKIINLLRMYWIYKLLSSCGKLCGNSSVNGLCLLLSYLYHCVPFISDDKQIWYETRSGKTGYSNIPKIKVQISCEVTVQLINTFVFTIQLVLSSCS